MSNEVQTEKLDDGTEVVTTTSIAGKATGAGSAVTTLPPATATPTPLEQTITAVAPTLITNILESFKKIGMPATVAAIVSVVVTVTPFLFKIDERYAKASELEASIERNKEDLAKLTAEVGKVAGAVDVLSQIVGKQYEAIQEVNATTRRLAAPQRAIIAAAPAPAPIVAEEEYAYEESEEYAYEEDAPLEAATEEYPAELEYDSTQDIDDSLNMLRKSLDESRKTLHEIQERQE